MYGSADDHLPVEAVSDEVDELPKPRVKSNSPCSESSLQHHSSAPTITQTVTGIKPYTTFTLYLVERAFPFFLLIALRLFDPWLMGGTKLAVARAL